MPKQNNPSVLACPCGSKKNYADCCEPLHQGLPAASAEALMRSRYCAFALDIPAYVHSSWHASTRPADAAEPNKVAMHWLGLTIKRHEPVDATHALVDFVARYKIDGRAYRLQEVSRFVLENGHWFYLDGEQKSN